MTAVSQHSSNGKTLELASAGWSSCQPVKNLVGVCGQEGMQPECLSFDRGAGEPSYVDGATTEDSLARSSLRVILKDKL